ncbi:RRM domain-containing protein [Mycena chlorophos]|uniref:RRM domain-containing protein n=1 Tax=Mycena chlorophos TaxID=658473 RepID=A0A8H6WCG7_MYCCL|nr:RRM domain-containing protein [Mycena chlorophos]
MPARSFFRSRLDSTRARSPSPTFSDITNASQMNLVNGPEKIITRQNLKQSVGALEELMATSAHYRSALVNLSNCSAAFANALQTASSLKGPSYEAATRLQAAGGLQHMMSGQWIVLADTLDKKFERPLRSHLDTYKTVVAERSMTYEKALKEKSQIIRSTEMQNMNRKERNLQSFREALAVLQRQVDDLDDLKVAHYQEIVDHEEEVWDVVQNKVCIAVRSTMDVFDRFTSKASDPVIEPMLASVPDAFDAYRQPQADQPEIFSILAPLSIMSSSTPSPMPTPIPELGPIEGLPASSSDHGWASASSVTFPSTSPSWDEDRHSPTDTPPRSVSPPNARKHVTPLLSNRHTRKSESKLRSVLSPIDEAKTRQKSPDARPVSIMGTLSAGSPPGDTQPWYGHAAQEDTDDRDVKTPTHSTFLSATPPRSPPPPEPSFKDRDGMKVPIAT